MVSSSVEAELEKVAITIRDACEGDSTAACEVVRRSIVELCVTDHREDQVILAQWLRNKTPENMSAWIARGDNSVLVAVAEPDKILAVGCVTKAGEITLNYVSPDARFRGVSRALLSALETRALERGNARCTLTSTKTALRFYRDAGYIDDAHTVSKFGMQTPAMAKILRGI
jgi:GNAT superfamily N-acetyltransferase